MTERSSDEFGPDALETACAALGISLGDRERRLLLRFEQWLADEAIEGGGIGPGERDRLRRRHILDSLAFAAGFIPPVEGRLLDVGSGVGLPGLPLGIVFPNLEVTLLDRAGRRIDLASRAIRVLGLENVRAKHAEAASIEPGWDYVTMRAVLPPDEAVRAVRRLLRPGGSGVVGVSRSEHPEVETGGWGSDVSLLRVDVLDSPVWILTIRP